MPHIIKYMYFCMYISVICLVVITWAIGHSFAGHQGLASVRAKLTNTICEELRLSWVHYKPRGDKQKNVIFWLVTTASPVCTWCIIGQIRMHRHTPWPSTVLLITKRCILMSTKNSPQCPYTTYNKMYVLLYVYKCNMPCGEHLSNWTFLCWSPRATQCSC